MTDGAPQAPGLSRRAVKARRIAAAATAAVTVLLGLLAHSAGWGVVSNALYTVLVYLLIVIVVPRGHRGYIAIGAYVASVAIEIFQATGIPAELAAAFPPAHLVLGSGFDPADIAWYLLGAGVALAGDVLVGRAFHPPRTPPALSEWTE